MSESTRRLPPGVDLAWRRRDRPPRGRKPSLSQDAIVEAAVSLADDEGLEGVSMARVAERLGFTTMSLYRYVASKDELLVLVTDAAVGPPPQIEAGEGWRTGLERWSWGLLSAYRSHPWLVRVPTASPPSTPHRLTWLDRCLSALADTRVPEGEKVEVALLLAGYVHNTAMLQVDLAGAASPADDDQWATYGEILAQVVDAKEMPALARAVAAGIFEVEDYSDEDFRFGLDRILDGVEALVRSRS